MTKQGAISDEHGQFTVVVLAPEEVWGLKKTKESLLLAISGDRGSEWLLKRLARRLCLMECT